MNCRGIPYKLKINMKKIVAFGNPLLDTTVFVQDNSLLNKYNLKEDGQKEIAANEMRNIYDDISSYEQHKSAGGCAQNSLRVLQWLLKKQCEAIIFGSVGKDEDAITLKKLVEKDGVQTRYIEQSNLPTGKTVALVKSPYRSLVACLGAAEKLPLNDLLANEDFGQLILNSDFVYIEGFFLTGRTETAQYILDFCNKQNKTIIFNISGEYVCNICPETVEYFAKHADIVFGNKREFEAVAKIMHITVEELMKLLIGSERKNIETYGKIIIITDGPRAGTWICNGNTEKFDVPVIAKTDIIDTTGAGDAFTGGFIAGLCASRPIQECAKMGCYAAFHIIQQTGCTLPSFEPNLMNL